MQGDGGDMCEVRWVKILQENLSQSVRIPKWRGELLPSLLLEKRFAQYFHGNAEPSASWPHAHTHAYRVLRFTTSTIAALFADFNTQATAKCSGYSFPATHQSRIRCTDLPMNSICFLSIGCIQKEKAKNKTRRAISAGCVCFDSSAAQYLAEVFEFDKNPPTFAHVQVAAGRAIRAPRNKNIKIRFHLLPSHTEQPFHLRASQLSSAAISRLNCGEEKKITLIAGSAKHRLCVSRMRLWLLRRGSLYLHFNRR